MNRVPVLPLALAPRRWQRARALGLSAALALLGSVGFAQPAQDCRIDAQRVDPDNAATLKGKSGLMRCTDREGGALVREQQIRNGAFVGMVRLYERGRLVKSYSLNAKGNIDGPARELSPGGQVLRESTYDDGHEAGLVRSYHPDGKLRRVAFLDDLGGERAMVEFTQRGQYATLRCGDRPMLAPAVDDARLCGFKGTLAQSELYDEQGKLRSRLVHLAGKRVRTESLYDNGRIARQEEIGDKVRIERRFSSEGIKRYELLSQAGERGMVRQREQAFSEKGQLLHDQRWNRAGEPVSDVSYTPSGQLLSRTVYSGSGAVRMADVVEFHPNGRRAAQGRFLAAARAPLVPVGTHQRFSERGVLIGESTYNALGRVTRERIWDDSGQPVRDEAVLADGTRQSH